ncbi:MAG: MBOAT family protein, partial [Huintestinicola sp.]
MVFSELTFLYFFMPVVILLHFFAGKRARNLIIFFTGLLFYAWGEPFYVVLMLFSTAIDYTAGRLMAKYDDDNRKRKLCLIVSICMNVGLLAVFKYSDFFIDSINAVTGLAITNPVLTVNKALNKIAPFGLNEKSVALPIGISFYTFQSMSYTIDLYLRNISVQKSFINFASYVSLFPQRV